ncbi:MAG TPA: hypothetical protein VJU80_17475, partial [Solirubrobacteraceae bacterium]|nr:hypothetical protein [Solirubrobacteraceae bacterium]
VSGGTYSSLTVPSGQFCFLSNATILGNATVQSTGSLELDQDGTIYGNVLVTNNQSEMLVFHNHIHQNFACYGNNPPPYTDLGAGLENTVDGRSLGQCATPNAPSAGVVASARPALKAAGVPAP